MAAGIKAVTEVMVVAPMAQPELIHTDLVAEVVLKLTAEPEVLHGLQAEDPDRLGLLVRAETAELISTTVMRPVAAAAAAGSAAAAAEATILVLLHSSAAAAAAAVQVWCLRAAAVQLVRKRVLVRFPSVMPVVLLQSQLILLLYVLVQVRS
jgi:hypothetical protein